MPRERVYLKYTFDKGEPLPEEKRFARKKMRVKGKFSKVSHLPDGIVDRKEVKVQNELKTYGEIYRKLIGLEKKGF